jgi:hypothetical protein
MEITNTSTAFYFSLEGMQTDRHQKALDGTTISNYMIKLKYPINPSMKFMVLILIVHSSNCLKQKWDYPNPTSLVF